MRCSEKNKKKTMKRITLFIMVLLAVVMSVAAQNATAILDQSAAALKKAGNARIDFTCVISGSAADGCIKLQGSKFFLNMGGLQTWFDGKTMWQYNKKNEEVTVTEPTADELSKINPYSFLTFYKKGYKVSVGKGTAKEQQVVLTGSGSGQYKKVVMMISKKTHYPTSINLTSGNGHTLAITCKSVHSNQKFGPASFKFDKRSYPKAEIVDLR